MDNTILGYTPHQAEAVSFELQNTVLDLINLAEREDPQTAIDTVVTGLSVRVAILDELITPEDAEKLVTGSDGDFQAIVEDLHSRALAKLFEV